MVTTNAIISDISYGIGLLSSFGQQVDVVGIYANGGSTNATQAGGGLFGTGISSSIISSVIGQTTAQAGLGQMFQNARPMKATIRETSRVMEHPVESGVVLADHHIINPIEIDLPLVVTSSSTGLIGTLLGTLAQNYAATYAQIRQAFLNATPLAVKTRVGTYNDMIIADMPHEEDPEMFDVITIALHLKQVIYVVNGTNPATGVSGGTLNSFQPLNSIYGNTAPSGLQQAASVAGSLLTAGTAVASYANLGNFL